MPQMSNERRRELELTEGAKLSQAELRQGYHFCPDWDFLVVGPQDVEAACCFCAQRKTGGNSAK